MDARHQHRGNLVDARHVVRLQTLLSFADTGHRAGEIHKGLSFHYEPIRRWGEFAGYHSRAALRAATERWYV